MVIGEMAAVTARFQSTRPRGARHQLPVAGVALGMFQSTRPRGARPVFADLADQLVEVSIHAPARGATPTLKHLKRFRELFQSTRPRGARLVVLDRRRPAVDVSIHAPARGATLQAS